MRWVFLTALLVTFGYMYMENNSLPTECPGGGEQFLAYLILASVILSPIILAIGNYKLRRMRLIIEAKERSDAASRLQQQRQHP